MSLHEDETGKYLCTYLILTMFPFLKLKECATLPDHNNHNVLLLCVRSLLYRFCNYRFTEDNLQFYSVRFHNTDFCLSVQYCRGNIRLIPWTTFVFMESWRYCQWVILLMTLGGGIDTVTVDEVLFLRICNLPLCRVTVSVGDYLLNNVRGSPWPFVGSLYNRYCL